MLNGNSACCNGNSYLGEGSQARFLPWVFRAAMPIPVTLIMGG